MARLQEENAGASDTESKATSEGTHFPSGASWHQNKSWCLWESLWPSQGEGTSRRHLKCTKTQQSNFHYPTHIPHPPAKEFLILWYDGHMPYTIFLRMPLLMLQELTWNKQALLLIASLCQSWRTGRTK